MDTPTKAQNVKQDSQNVSFSCKSNGWLQDTASLEQGSPITPPLIQPWLVPELGQHLQVIGTLRGIIHTAWGGFKRYESRHQLEVPKHIKVY